MYVHGRKQSFSDFFGARGQETEREEGDESYDDGELWVYTYREKDFFGVRGQETEREKKEMRVTVMVNFGFIPLMRK